MTTLPPFTDAEWRTIWESAMVMTMVCEQSKDPAIHYSGVGASALEAINRVLGDKRASILTPSTETPS